MFWGCASGSQRKALQRLAEPNVMISFATHNNQPWDGIDRLFIDCGGYSMLKAGKDHPDKAEYQEYLETVQPEIYALPDYPCEPDLLEEKGRSVQDHQRLTTEAHVDMLEADPPGQPLSVLQGWETAEYLTHLDDLRDHGAVTDYVGIGSVCRRHAESEIRDVILTVRDALPDSTKLHAFGVKTSVLGLTGVMGTLTSADSLSYGFREQHTETWRSGDRWKRVAYHYLNMKREVDLLQPDDPAQTTLAEVV